MMNHNPHLNNRSSRWFHDQTIIRKNLKWLSMILKTSPSHNDISWYFMIFPCPFLIATRYWILTVPPALWRSWQILRTQWASKPPFSKCCIMASPRNTVPKFCFFTKYIGHACMYLWQNIMSQSFTRCFTRLTRCFAVVKPYSNQFFLLQVCSVSQFCIVQNRSLSFPKLMIAASSLAFFAERHQRLLRRSLQNPGFGDRMRRCPSEQRRWWIQ